MRVRLGELLLRQGHVTPAQLQEALNHQRANGGKLGPTLVKLGMVKDEDILNALSRLYGVPFVKLAELVIDASVLRLIPVDVAQKYQVVPVNRSSTTLTVAMVNPANHFALDDIRFMTGYTVEPIVASETAVAEAIRKYYLGAFPVERPTHQDNGDDCRRGASTGPCDEQKVDLPELNRREDLRARLERMPWHARMPLDLVLACRAPLGRPTPPPGTRWETVRLPYRRSGTKVAGGKALIAGEYPELFVVLGWTPVDFLGSIFHMIPPITAASEPPAEILVPRPDEDQIVDLAYDHAEAGLGWHGTAWLWPASYRPPRVDRVWEPASRGVWDGVDQHGNRTGGAFEQAAGWRDKSNDASFDIGLSGLWSFRISWTPDPIIDEQVGRQPAERRPLTFDRGTTLL